MEKAKKIRKRVGIGMSILCIVLSFFPVIVFSSWEGQTVFQLLKNRTFIDLPFGIGKIIILNYLAVPVVYFINLILWVINKEKSGAGATSTTMLLLALNVVIPTICLETIPVEFIMIPFSGWVAIRCFIGVFELLNRNSGEEVYAFLLKKKLN